MADRRIRGTYGGTWGSKMELELTPQLLKKIGECLVKHFAREALKDFAKRGWSVKDPMGGPSIGNSFSYRIKGNRTVEVMSTFYGLDALVSGDIPEHRMTWLTQEAQGVATRRSGVKRTSLVVPLRADNGEVIFRTAPLKMADAWVHPGIAKFTFVQRAMTKAREECIQLMAQGLVDQLAKGLNGQKV